MAVSEGVTTGTAVTKGRKAKANMEGFARVLVGGAERMDIGKGIAGWAKPAKAKEKRAASEAGGSDLPMAIASPKDKDQRRMQDLKLGDLRCV